MVEVLGLLGFALILIGWVIILIEAFSEGVLWGLGSILLGPLYLIFTALYWARCKNGFYVHIAGVAMIIGAAIIQ